MAFYVNYISRIYGIKRTYLYHKPYKLTVVIRRGQVLLSFVLYSVNYLQICWYICVYI